MGAVYLAEDLKHHRRVAVKVLRPDLSASLGTDRFLREIEVAARLQHPAILPLHDSGQADGYVFYIMPYVEGESLRDRLARQHELTVEETARILSEVLDALAYAHGKGVVHRDIKPDNIMLSGRHALLLDFGVAKAVNDSAGPEFVTTTGLALGTPSYMAPEQAVADKQVDHRADLYAVGVVGYEMLAGRRPFPGNTAQQIVVAQMTKAPDELLTHRPSVPPPLAAALMRAIERNPADRWQSAAEMAARLEPYVVISGETTPAARTAFGPGRRRARWIGLAVAAVVLVAAIAGAVLLRPRPTPQLATRRSGAGDARSGTGDRAGDVTRRAPGGLRGRLDERAGDPGAAARAAARRSRWRPRASDPSGSRSGRLTAPGSCSAARAASRSSPPSAARRGWWCPTSTIPGWTRGAAAVRSCRRGGRPTVAGSRSCAGIPCWSGTWTGGRSGPWHRTERCTPSPGRPTADGSRVCGVTASRVSPASCSATSARPGSGSCPSTRAGSRYPSPTTSGSTPARPGPRTAAPCCS